MKCEFCGVTGPTAARRGSGLHRHGWSICAHCLKEGHTLEEVARERGLRLCPVCSNPVEIEPDPAAENPLLARIHPPAQSRGEPCPYCAARGDRFVTLPRTCPDCGSTRLRDLLFGQPPDWPDPASFRLGNPGRNEVRWYCRDCYCEW